MIHAEKTSDPPKNEKLYRQLAPSPHLAELVDSYWEFQNLTGAALSNTILPDGCFKMVVFRQNQRIASFFLAGLWTKETEIHIPEDVTVYGIRFKILAPEFIFNSSIAEIHQSMRKLDLEQWNLDDSKLTGLPEFVEHMESELSTRFAQTGSIPNPKLRLSELVYATRGELKAEVCASQLAWPQRQVNRYLNRYIGISLKSYLNILRCYQSFFHIREGRLFPEKGYYDQAHFIKDIKKHTNHTPKDLFKGKNDQFLQLRDIQDD